jgi:hypothetical protein
MAYKIVGLNLDTLVAWDEATGLTHAEALDMIETKRSLRWMTPDVVFAAVDPEKKIEHKRGRSVFEWALEVA